MNPATTAPPIEMESLRADRAGIAASVLCAIHCAAAPILLIFLPTFGSIWAHPASHILVAVFVVPLAYFSIRKGFKTHGKRWIVGSAGLGILFVLVGAALPAFGSETDATQNLAQTGGPSGEGVAGAADSECDDPECTDPECTDPECRDPACEDPECDDPACEAGCESASGEKGPDEGAACVDGCCPTATIGEDGKLSIHVPPASIVTTLGGFFLIAAHIGNLCACGRSCRKGDCRECAA
jgi:hypothetical protein